MKSILRRPSIFLQRWSSRPEQRTNCHHRGDEVSVIVAVILLLVVYILLLYLYLQSVRRDPFQAHLRQRSCRTYRTAQLFYIRKSRRLLYIYITYEATNCYLVGVYIYMYTRRQIVTSQKYTYIQSLRLYGYSLRLYVRQLRCRKFV